MKHVQNVCCWLQCLSTAQGLPSWILKAMCSAHASSTWALDHMQLQKMFRVLGSTNADARPSYWDVDLMMVGRAIGTERGWQGYWHRRGWQGYWHGSGWQGYWHGKGCNRVVQLMKYSIAAGAWDFSMSHAGKRQGCRGDPPARRQHKNEGGVAGGVIVAGLNGKGLGLHKAPPQGLRHKAAQGRGDLVRPQHAQRDNLLQGIQFAPPGFWQGGMVWLQAVVDLLP